WVEVVRDKEIEFAVTVEIEERAARAPAAFGPGGVWDFAEPAVTHIPIQRVWSDIGDVEVDQAVVFVVARACAHTVREMANTRGSCHVLERAVPAVPEQPMARALR